MNAPRAAIETSGLSKDYGEGRGVFDLDLEVRPGEVFGFLGPNGAGKSTMMKMLLGLISPSGGAARILGLDCAADGLAIKRRVGYLPGDFAMYPGLTGAEMLDHLASLRGGTSQAVRDTLADRFEAQLDRPIGDLSTGNRQKIGLISAFMHEPEVLILDEPIAGLDPLVQQSFHALLDETAAEGGTVLLSSHTLSRWSAWPCVADPPARTIRRSRHPREPQGGRGAPARGEHRGWPRACAADLAGVPRRPSTSAMKAITSWSAMRLGRPPGQGPHALWGPVPCAAAAVTSRRCSSTSTYRDRPPGPGGDGGEPGEWS
ncbi:MAG: ATP-binding cassette domain-containing protein [Solirubrobacterales bacterium]